MPRLNDEQQIRYLKRSYSAVDGLWFMKVEDSYDFDKALEIDNKVWEIVPKIQARFMKSALGMDRGIDALRTCFTEKLRLDDIEFTTASDETSLTITITECHWYNLMIQSDREHLSARVGETICDTEYSGWAKEFGDDISLKILHRICSGDKYCTLRFSKT